MRPLPAPVEHITAPERFSPSQLAFASGCLLRAVLGVGRPVDALDAHPAAALGRILHTLLERAARGQIDRRGAPGEDAARVLDELLDAAHGSGQLDLRGLYSPISWRRKRRATIDLAARFLSLSSERTPGGAPVRSRAGVGPLRTLADLPATGVWAEVQVDAPTLRLSGRADLVEKWAGGITIRDLKTGRVMDDGGVLPHIQLQMRLYGLMVRNVCPGAGVRLVVDRGEEQPVAFDDAIAAQTETWVRELLTRVPTCALVSAAELATPGESCGGCAYRHVCHAYQLAAPTWWLASAPFRPPLDVWGVIEAVQSASDGLADVTLRDAAGRMVRVFGLQARRVVNAEQGQGLWFFSLRSADRRGGPGAWRHPVNFHEVAGDDPHSHAWALEVFAGGSASA